MDSKNTYSEGYSETNGVKIFYRDYGPADGKPVLLVHGLGAQLVHWPPHLTAFLQEHNYRPITYDNRDAGLSSRFFGPFFWFFNKDLFTTITTKMIFFRIMFVCDR